LWAGIGLHEEGSSAARSRDDAQRLDKGRGDPCAAVPRVDSEVVELDLAPLLVELAQLVRSDPPDYVTRTRGDEAMKESPARSRRTYSSLGGLPV
jgi:hypothetical protein